MTKADIHSVTLGGTKATNETKNISKAVNLTDEEIPLVKELIERGDEVEIRMVPADKKMLAKKRSIKEEKYYDIEGIFTRLYCILGEM